MRDYKNLGYEDCKNMPSTRIINNLDKQVLPTIIIPKKRRGGNVSAWMKIAEIDFIRLLNNPTPSVSPKSNQD